MVKRNVKVPVFIENERVYGVAEKGFTYGFQFSYGYILNHPLKVLRHYLYYLKLKRYSKNHGY